MTQINWQPLEEEFQLWRDAGLILPLWWRDDDAIEPTPALDRLITLSSKFDVPLHLAIIPKFATSALVKRINSTSHIVPVVHGWAHENHAPEDQKNAEFGATRSIEDSATDAIMGLQRMNDLFGNQLKPMFVPPWNRINPELSPHLVAIGYDFLSTYAPRVAQYAAPNLTRMNTHLDPIAWRTDRSLQPRDMLVAQMVQLMQGRRNGHTDNAEPLGLLTHHLVHDEAIWDFVEHFFTIMLTGPVIAFRKTCDRIE